MASIRAINRNIPYLRQQFEALWGNTSLSVKFICVVVIVSYCFSFSKDAVEVLSVTPGKIIPPAFWVWTAFTFCFLELHFWEVLVDIVTVGLCGKLIEPLWGQMEMMTFFAVVNIGVAVLSTMYYYILYICTFDVDYLFVVNIHGLAGYIAGVTVAVKQIMPDLILIKTPLGKITNRNIPLLVFLISVLLWVVRLLEGTYATMFLSGLIVSWVYLRFYQYHSNGTRGDMADNFTFASFFPNVLQPPIAVLSNTIYGFFVKIGLCRKVVRKFDIANPTGITISIPGMDPHDMERRRQIALKALSERLSKGSDHPNSSKDKQPLLSKNIPTSKMALPSMPSKVTMPKTTPVLPPQQTVGANLPPTQPLIPDLSLPTTSEITPSTSSNQISESST